MPTPLTDRPLRYSLETSPFLDQVRQVLRLKHMSRRTEASYLHYNVDYIRLHGECARDTSLPVASC